ncbi:MAG: HYR domain-containing protein [gamma proteobacterium endosymbiont of Lamellibrachia anaximandri]|nr:HYR domain-containing protein [gamma proteobacterium endosymbiont of Lamellibrachia anaximandri]
MKRQTFGRSGAGFNRLLSLLSRLISSQVAITFATSLLVVSTAQAASADLDAAFGAAGVAATTIGGNQNPGTSVMVQPDGKIIGVSAPFSLVRLNGTGSVDTFYGTVGSVTSPPAAAVPFAAKASLLQPDGMLLVAGSGPGGGALLRYNTAGSPDTLFDGDGVLLDSTPNTYLGVALQPDGKIVTVGTRPWGFEFDMVVSRYLPNGLSDNDFNWFPSGYVITDLSAISVNGAVVAVQPDGKIVVVAGYTEQDRFGQVFVKRILTRLTSDGSSDFSTKFDTTASERPAAIAIQADGKILVVGSRIVAGGFSQPLLLRFNGDGTPDADFGTAGMVTDVPADCIHCDLFGMALAPDGKILVTGNHQAVVNGSTDDVVLRYNSDGTLDASFGINGEKVASLGNRHIRPRGIALQPDGKILIASNNLSGDLEIARLLGDPLDVTPDVFSFTDETDVAINAFQISNLITVAGLSVGVKVPVFIAGGEYDINASSLYSSNPGYVANGDQVGVRHLSPVTGPTDTDTTLSIGGTHAINSLPTLLSSQISGTYTTTTMIPPVPEPTVLVPADGALSNNNTPLVSGTSGAGHTITLSDNGVQIAILTADGAGNWNHTSTALADGDHIFTAIATDGGGASSAESAGVTLTIDTTPPNAPSIVTPADGAFINDSTPTLTGTAVASTTVTLLDGGVTLGSSTADGSGNWSFTYAPGLSPPLSEGSHSFTATARDAAENIGPASTAVGVTIDLTKPVLTVPAAITVDAASAAGILAASLPSFFAGASATDNLSGDLTVSDDAPATFPLGTTTVTFSADDAAGNSAVAFSQVTVVDQTGPVITPPAPITLPAVDASGVPTSNASAFFNGATAVDVIDGARSVFHDFMPRDNLVPLGTTTVTFRSSDGSGNSSTATSTITVTDQTPPVITPPADVTLAATSASGVAASAANGFLTGATANDNVDGVVTTAHNAPASFPLGSTMVTFSATDAAGNAGTVTATVTVSDLLAPSLTVANGLIMFGDAALGGVNRTHVQVQGFLDFAAAQDNVDVPPALSNDMPFLLPFGATTVTFTATDAAGNSTTATAVVHINNPEAIGDDAAAASGTGLTIGQSNAAGLDPNATTTDTDGDGVGDNREVGDPANPSDQDGDGVLDVFESGNAASDASHVDGLATTTGTVDIQSSGQSLSQVTSSATTAGAPSGVVFPFGVISYETTVTAAGASQTVRLSFSEPLPDGLVLYKVDLGGNYTAIPAAQWTQVDANSIDLTLTDGGPFDLDGLADGKIVDPLAPGSAPVADESSSGGGGSASPWIFLLFLLVMVRRAKEFGSRSRF